jgi:hypothetical protein
MTHLSGIPNPEVDYYGDDVRWFIGTIININDPLQLGRCQIRIFGVHPDRTSDLANADLPWAQTVSPITEGGSSGIGTNVGIQPLALVYGIFLDGKNSQLPLVIGSMPKYERDPLRLREDTTGLIADQVQRSNITQSHNEVKNFVPAPIIDKELLVGSDNNERAFNYFLTSEGGGFTPAQAAGMIGNFCVESFANLRGGEISPTQEALNGDGSFGIAQWYPGGAENRLAQLKNFAANNNLPYNSLYAQLTFTTHELYTKSYFGLRELKASRTPAEASKTFELRFERPLKTAARSDERIAFAEENYRKLK